MDKLKKYHAYLVMWFVFLITCFVTGDYIFFPFACIFLCLYAYGYLKDHGRLALPENQKSIQSSAAQAPSEKPEEPNSAKDGTQENTETDED